MRLFDHYSDLLSLLQCQSATNVPIVVELHINFFLNQKFWRVTSTPDYRESHVGHFRGRGKTGSEATLHLYECNLYVVALQIL